MTLAHLVAAALGAFVLGCATGATLTHRYNVAEKNAEHNRTQLEGARGIITRIDDTARRAQAAHEQIKERDAQLLTRWVEIEQLAQRREKLWRKNNETDIACAAWLRQPVTCGLHDAATDSRSPETAVYSSP